MKQLLISISYNHFILPPEADISEAIKIVGHMMPVERDTYEGKTIYSPEKQVDISFDLIDSKLIRIPTPEEKENKKIEDLESSLKYNRDLVKDKDEKIKALKCELELMKSEDNKQEISD